MFGASQSGWIGGSLFAFGENASPWLLAFFLFQLVFCGTATTIISGAVAERMRFKTYVLLSLLVAGVIYPVFGHWAWGGAAGVGGQGWLAAEGFIDFAGSAVVHSVGGFVALEQPGSQKNATGASSTMSWKASSAVPPTASS